MVTTKLTRRARISASALFGVFCVLLVALWMRSYRYWDQLYNPVSNSTLIIVESASGRVLLRLTTTVPGSPWTCHIPQALRDEYWGGPLKDWEEANRHKGIGGFAAHGRPWYTTYRAPYWFLAIMFAASTVAPWLRSSTRFSLRTLLIAITVIAVILGGRLSQTDRHMDPGKHEHDA
jgi:hypothetical protein